jgi:HlyD family secretion protein
MKKVLIILFAIATLGVAVGGLYYLWINYSVRQPAFRTLPVTRGDLLVSVSATGSVEPVEIIDVGAQIVGIITKFGPDVDRPGKTIDFRSHVKQGAILAQLDDLPHRAELKKAIANLKLADGQLVRARAHLRQTESEFHRAEKLVGTNSVSDYETALANFDMAKADVVVAEATVEQSAVAKEQAEINLSYTVIRSPVEGVVIDRRVNVGQTVVAGLNAPSLFLMAKDLSRMLVWSGVNEADIGDIHVGQAVTFKVDAYRDVPFHGKVSQIRLNASMLQSVVTYGVVVDVDNTQGMLMPYMTARLQFEVARRSNCLLVPNQALRWRPTRDEISPPAWAEIQPSAVKKGASQGEDSAAGDESEERVDLGTPTVWVVAEDGFVRPVKVGTGISDGVNTEITSGDLQPTDAVAVNTVREVKPDFVSSFILQLTKK